MADDTPSGEVPEEFRAHVERPPRDVGRVYNDLGELGDAAFEAAVAGSLETLQEHTAGERGEFAAVLGLEFDDGTLADATLLSVRELGGDRVLHVDGGSAVPDAVVYLPVRPDDCPPGSGTAVEDLDLADYREMVASMVFLRYELMENASDRYDDLVGRPLARGLETYAGE